MFEAVLLFLLFLVFFAGYSTRSYVGAIVPGVILGGAIVIYAGRTDMNDEVDVLPGIYLVASIVAVLLYLAGVALGRRSRGVH